MKILHYTQYVFGIGHLFRSMAIDRALAPLTVDLVTGGAEVPIPLPASVRPHARPAIRMAASYGSVLAVVRERDLEDTWREREAMLLDPSAPCGPTSCSSRCSPSAAASSPRTPAAAALQQRTPPPRRGPVQPARHPRGEEGPGQVRERTLGWLKPVVSTACWFTRTPTSCAWT